VLNIPILIVLGLGFVVLSYYSFQKTSMFLQSASSAEGRVVNLTPRYSNDSSPTYAAVVEYKDNRGRTHQFTDSLSSNPPSFRAGERVNALYSPTEPPQAQIEGASGNYLITLLSGGIGTILAAVGIGLLIRRLGRR